jgi:hypothetical protein
MNLLGLQNDLYGRLAFDSTTVAAAVTTRLTRYLNEGQRAILARKGLSKLRRAVMPFTSSTTSPFCVLPQAAVRVIAIADRTNMRTLQELSLQDLRAEDPGLTSVSASPHGYVIVDLSASVAFDPSAAAELFVISTDAADGATKTAFLEGITTGGYPRSASAVLNGVTGVSFGATIIDWIAVTKFYLGLSAGGLTTAAGRVTLRQTSGAGTELARIPIGRAYARYTRIQLWPSPTTALTYSADVERHVEDMVQPSDEPLVPEDFSHLLVDYAMTLEYQRQGKVSLLAGATAKYLDGVNELIAFVNRTTGAANGARERRFSQLGSYFPVGS